MYTRASLKKIPLQYSKFVFNPDSMRVRILNLKWELDHKNTSYDEMRKNNSPILDYLNIIDDDTMRRKLNDIVRYMD